MLPCVAQLFGNVAETAAAKAELDTVKDKLQTTERELAASREETRKAQGEVAMSAASWTEIDGHRAKLAKLDLI